MPQNKNKTLFNTSSKSDFIVNMTEETYTKLASWGLFAACLAVPLFTILPEASDAHTYNIASVGLALPGVYCLVMALIAFMKKYIRKEVMLPVAAISLFVGWSAVSLLASDDKDIGFKGFPGRCEGFLSSLYYFGFFVTGLSLKREKSLRTLLYGVLASGWLNSIFAMIQIITKEHRLSHYSFIGVFFYFAASGLAHSPIFLAFLLSLCNTLALVTAAVCKDNRLRAFCIASAAEFSFVTIYTYCYMSLAGLIFAGLAFLAALIYKKAPVLRVIILLVPAAFAGLSYCSIQKNTFNAMMKYDIHDGYILWTGDSYKRISSSGNYDKQKVNIKNNKEVYSYLNEKTFDILKDKPLTGAGPEQLAFAQGVDKKNENGVELEYWEDIFTSTTNDGVFDKAYNEYLYIGATRGVPAMLALIGAMLSAIVLSFKNMRKRGSEESVALFFCALFCAAGLIFCCSSIGFAPVLWAVAGASCATIDKVYDKKLSPAKAPGKKSSGKKEAPAEKPEEEKTSAKENSPKPEAKKASPAKKKNGPKKGGKKSSK